MSDIAIRIENLSKMYRIGGPQEKYSTLRDTISRNMTMPLERFRGLLRGESASGYTKEIWALKDVSFEVKKGEVVGIIGRNGAGKSTLLKILSRITEPTSGYIEVFGRVGALLEVGTGFHPELTGRENVYLNGAILGMSQHDIGRKFDEIVHFAGVEKFIDTPVKHYSSGMGLRLGFAVAAHMEPEILVVDEVLAVGDAEFQKKCLGKMSDVAREGRTVLLVSHNMTAIHSMCQQVIWIDDGRVRLQSTPVRSIEAYLSSSHQVDVLAHLGSRTDRVGSRRLTFQSVKVINPDSGIIASGDPVNIELEYELCDPLPHDDVKVAIVFIGPSGERIFTCSLEFRQGEFTMWPETGQVTCAIQSLPLLPGQYSLYLWSAVQKQQTDTFPNLGNLIVHERDFFGSGKLPKYSNHGAVLVQHSWLIKASTDPHNLNKITGFGG